MRNKMIRRFAAYAAVAIFPLQGTCTEAAIGETATRWATVSLVSRDGGGFGSAGKASILVAASASSGNSGSRVERVGESEVRLAERGTAPVLVEGVPCDITMPQPTDRVRCWALGPDGGREAEIRPEATTDGKGSVLRLGPAHKTLWYEISIN